MGRMYGYIVFFVALTLIMEFLGFGFANERILSQLGLPTVSGGLDIDKITNESVSLQTTVNKVGKTRTVSSSFPIFKVLLGALIGAIGVGIFLGIRGGGFQPENFILLIVVFGTIVLMMDVAAGMIQQVSTFEPSFAGIMILIYVTLSAGFVITTAEWFRGNV